MVMVIVIVIVIAIVMVIVIVIVINIVDVIEKEFAQCNLSSKGKSMKDYSRRSKFEQTGSLFHRQTLTLGNNINIVNNQIVRQNSDYSEYFLRTKTFSKLIIKEFSAFYIYFTKANTMTFLLTL